MSAEITPAEGGGAVGAAVALVTVVINAFRLHSQIAKLRARVTVAETKATNAEAEVKALEERIASAVSDALAAHPSFADPPPVRQTTGAFSSTEALERIVEEKVRAYGARADAAQDAKIQGISDRVGDVKRLVELMAESVLKGAPR